MFVFFGLKNYSPKCVGYASDFCESCKQPAIVAKWRSFACGHIFWIPLIPFGYKNTWLCSLCGQNAEGEPKTSAGAKIVAAVLFGFMAFVFYDGGAENGTAGSGLLLPVLFGALSAGFVAWIFFHRARPSVEKRNAIIPPVDTNHCAFCGGRLVQEPSVRCESCDLEVIETNSASG